MQNLEFTNVKCVRTTHSSTLNYIKKTTNKRNTHTDPQTIEYIEIKHLQTSQQLW